MITLHRQRELPSVRLFWLDDVGGAVDFSAGTWTWAVSIEQDLVTTTLSGVTVTANVSPTTWTGKAADVASLTLSFAAGALDGVSVGPAELRVVGTTSGLDREGRWPAVVK